jgi:tRNA 2-thiouridine synthesizing protein A
MDLRGLEPPLPILAILKKVAELSPSAWVHVKIDSNPWQLYDLLQQRGFNYLATRLADGSYEAKIVPRDSAPH